jgi:CubicO group peptidase (beta-lactamase class C family)
MKLRVARVEQLVEESGHKLGVAGIAAAIVGPGSDSLTRGFGFSDVAVRTEASEKTLFRIGSMSKLITATAVMQLVEVGKLELDTDVNHYLETELQIPPNFARPVTLKNLLTHTAGFEENQLGYMVKRSAAELVPLARHLANHKPAQVRAPTTNFSDGRGASYSNWGMALAGHIVARRAQMSFDDYVERRIFEPLGMVRSTFREPMPRDLAFRLSKGYHAGPGGVLTEHGFEFFHSIGPAGSMSTTAADMSLFMHAHLAMRASVLKPMTMRLMQSRVLDPHPMVNGAGLGFYEINLNGRRVVGHQGSTICFVSQLVLVPEEGLGIFVVVNTRVSPRRLHGVVRTLMDVLLPMPITTAVALHSTSLDRYAGSYLATPHSHRGSEKFLLLAAPEYEMKVTTSPQGSLRISNLAGRREWVGIAPGVFRQEGSQEIVAFVEDANGRVTHMLGPASFAPAYKVEPCQTPAFHRELLEHAATGFHLTLGWHAAATGSGSASPSMVPALAAAAMVSALNLAGLSLIRKSFAEGAIALVYGYPDSFREGLTLIQRASELTNPVLQLTLRAWVHEEWTQGERQGFAAVSALLLAFFESLHFWNLLGRPVA